MKLDVKKTFILGLGFFAVSLVWPLYNVYVPIFLRDFLDSQFLINAIMTLDNILAVFLIPVVAALSDRTKTRFGRRMPYLMVGIPVSAIMFVLLPNYTSFLSFMIILTILNFAMAIYRAPTVALMPDITPAPLRSQANGIINFMGGLASVVVLIGGSFLYRANRNYPFVLTAILLFFALGMLLKFIKEPEVGVASDEEGAGGILAAMRDILREKDKTSLYILLAIFFWFVAYQGVEATFSNYAVYFLGMNEADASLFLGFFALAFLLSSIPAGFVGTKLGKRRTILIGIIGDAAVFIALTLVGTIIPFSKPLMMGLLFLGGIFWGLININSYPYIVERSSEEKIGTYTGLYYFSSSLAAISGPLIVGAFVDLLGFGIMFPLTGIAFVVAYYFISKTKEVVVNK